MYDWIIIGGGIHGCTVAAYLLKSGRTSIDNIRIIDPHDGPLHNWKRNTERIGMEFLRSPFVHHLDVHPFSLQKAAKSKGPLNFYGRYKRPSLSLFNEHSDTVLHETKLEDAWVKGRVEDVTKEKETWKVHTETGRVINGRNIVISISLSEQLNIPEWAAKLQTESEHRIHHIFDPELPEMVSESMPLMVVGGGITAAHTSIKLSRLFPGKVTVLKRHPFRVHDFDSNPGWLGPKNMDSFLQLKDYEERRAAIGQARHRGSITAELHARLNKLSREGSLTIADGEVVSAESDPQGISLLLDTDVRIEAKSIILATGFTPTMPQQEWLQKLIKRERLKCANCGYPVVEPSLEWCPHLYVTGPLAELEIGPVSRNIAGARKAAERIVLNRM
ncbi:FAD/NAD(P)-binding protein [Bacillus sp. SG-1]|uniref:FAD/NAD(P)-binding protein n=1 Tax=Bacillus sp. SG-1 TaxID=161544 RepID=UPI0001544DA9|nr:FAD/NAD(P)-binding protein [Bacillus sp. SG-1]EDL62864.1 hypothetical protein BSG1_12826 [Bacillus sp. SG-1]